MKIRDNYHKLSIKYKQSDLAKTRFKFYRNKVTSLIRTKRRKDTEKYFTENMDDQRKIWRHINNIFLNRNSPPNNDITQLKMLTSFE